MNKSELVSTIAQKLEKSNADVSATLNAFIEVVGETVAGGDKVSIPGFLSFERVHREARTGRNPRNPSEVIQIPASMAVKVTPGAALKKQVKGG